MAYNSIVASFCEDKDNPFSVKSELKVRKMLEKYTSSIPKGWAFEFVRNEDQFGVDIICHKYIQRGNRFEKLEIGRIEVEVSKQWKNGNYPPFWKTYSYLRRKVELWDVTGDDVEILEGDVFYNKPVERSDKKIYLKCAIDMTDCHCALVSDIYKFGEIWVDKRPGLPPDRSNYMRFPLKENSINKRGWEQSIKYIVSILDR